MCHLILLVCYIYILSDVIDYFPPFYFSVSSIEQGLFKLGCEDWDRYDFTLSKLVKSSVAIINIWDTIGRL